MPEGWNYFLENRCVCRIFPLLELAEPQSRVHRTTRTFPLLRLHDDQGCINCMPSLFYKCKLVVIKIGSSQTKSILEHFAPRIFSE